MSNSNSNKIIKDFVANIIDIYKDDAISMFITNGNLNVDNLITHHLTKITTLYHVVYYHLFGIWATKKNVMSFFDDVLNIKSNYNTFKINLELNLLNAILAHEPFFIARVGAVHKMNSLRDVFVSAINRINEPSPISYICDILQQKWKHRYNAMDMEMMTSSNILKTFIKYQLHNHIGNEEHTHVWKDVTGFKTDCKVLDKEDFEYLNMNEVIQYHISCDTRFLLQLSTFGVIVKENDDVDDFDIVTLNKSIQIHCKKNVMTLSVDSDKVKDVRFSYKIDKELFRLLPKISTKYYLISNEKRVSTHLLCSIPTESMLITCDPSVITPEQRSHFALLFTPSVEQVCPKNSVYHFPTFNSSLDLSLNSANILREIQLSIWKEYHHMKCPFQTQNSRHCGMLFVNFISLYLHKHIKDIETVLQQYVPINNSKKFSVVAVDNRFNPLTLVSVLVSLYNIVKYRQERHINGLIYTSRQFADKYKKLIEDLSLSALINVKLVEAFEEVDMFSLEIYNEVLKSEWFWGSMDCEKCIIVQDDGFLMNGKNIDEYTQYDYVGAPWADVKDNEYIKKNINSELVGNGGFSLRDVQRMKHICATYVTEKKELFYHNLNEIPEDVYFVKQLVKMGAKIAPFDVARKFATEQVLTFNPVGFHKFWLYNLPTESMKLFDSFLY